MSRAKSTRATSSSSREWSAKHVRVKEELASQVVCTIIIFLICLIGEILMYRDPNMNNRDRLVG